jgi:hypothetical protein
LINAFESIYSVSKLSYARQTILISIDNKVLHAYDIIHYHHFVLITLLIKMLGVQSLVAGAPLHNLSLITRQSCAQNPISWRDKKKSFHGEINYKSVGDFSSLAFHSANVPKLARFKGIAWCSRRPGLPAAHSRDITKVACLLTCSIKVKNI